MGKKRSARILRLTSPNAMSEKKDIEKFNGHSQLPWAVADFKGQGAPGINAADGDAVVFYALLEEIGNNGLGGKSPLANADFIVEASNTYYEKEASLRSYKELVDELGQLLQSLVDEIDQRPVDHVLGANIRSSRSSIIASITKAKAATSNN